ncbi:MAG: pyridoxal-dependent decarboxylase, exosortase A system-associated [Porticoccaceae bacterium]|nr:pyridoxal-dependent decarboxylase, exosortase A system-associated [Porticoccaceae bacterium]
MNERIRHTHIDRFSRDGNDLLIGGIPVRELAIRIGQTPFYAYDRSVMTDRVNGLKKLLPEKVRLHYAIKANPMPAVVHHLQHLVDGLDVASLEEMRIALDTGVKPESISFAGPGKSEKELKAAIAAGVIVILESAGELQRVVNHSQALDIRARVAVRVNPLFELKTSGMKMAGGPKPFGVDAEKVPSLLEAIGKSPVEFRGFHIFCGSQNLKAETLIEAHNNTFELVKALLQSAPSSLRWLNIGGGFGIPYFPGELPLDIEPIAANLHRLMDEHKAWLKDTEVVMELGRYFVGEAGVYVSEVIDIKESRGETFVVTNGGLHHHLSVSGNFGQIIRKNYPVCIGNKVGESHLHPVTVVGPLCTPMDIIADKYPLPHCDIGDLIVVFQSGAYGASASPQRFLSHPPVIEVVV